MATIKTVSGKGDETLLDYDPKTANMKEVNQYIKNLEKETGGRTFTDPGGELVTKITPETGDVLHIKPIAGG
jgi:hypothetical protein